MAIIKCKMCGGDLNIIEGQSIAECEYCGSRQTVPTADNEKKLTVFARANRLRAACEFDKAAGIYESIVADFPEEAEAYWGLVLCKYGIEYVDDPATGKKIPTCHRSSFDSVMDDSNFDQAMENADAVALKVYREEAKQIEGIRKGILEVSSNEQPYDIFICYKETDANGDRSVDSLLAQDIYDALTGKGYRVFFSRITLEDKLGQAYEPYIFAALNSAKIMLAVGTCYEHYNAVWVKNEWSRYLKIIAQDKNKYMIPCYKGIDAYDIPKEFAHLQGQDMGKVGAIADLLRGIEKLLPRQHGNTVVIQTSVPTEVSALENLLKRGQLALEDDQWTEAKEFFNQALNIDAECGEAYLGLELAAKKCHTPGRLGSTYPLYYANYRYPEESKLMQRARQFADAATKEKLDEFDAALKAKVVEVEKARQESTYNKAVQAMNDAKTERDFLLAAEIFHTVSGHKDADECAKKCEDRAAHIRRKKEEKIQFLAAKREKSARASTLIYAVDVNSLVVKLDGTVVELGYPNGVTYNLHGWSDIVASCQFGHDVGLKSDGTVVAEGDNKYGQCNVSDWKDIVAISAGDYYTIGLKSDGTVVAIGDNKYGQCNVSDWKDIVAISAGYHHTVGLKADGKVVAVGLNEHGQCNVSGWEDTVAISASDYHTVGLKADGKVVAVGLNDSGECDVSGWEDIIAISADYSTTAGLKADGTVVAVGDNKYSQCNDVASWKDILAISAGASHIIGLQTDGILVAVGDNDYHQCDLSGWKLFKSFDNLEQERQLAAEEKRKADERARREAEERAKQQADWRASGVCQHCGGQLKGLLGKKCVNCGCPKDY